MANKRTLQCTRLTTNGVAIDGLTDLGFAAGFQDLIASAMDGAIGVQDVERAGLNVGVTLRCADVTKVATLLAAAVGNTNFATKESGAATYHVYLIDQSEDGWIVWHGMNLDFAKNSDGALGLNGTVCFASGAKTLIDLLEPTAGVVAGDAAGQLDVLTRAWDRPARLYRPHLASFDPYLVAGDTDKIDPLHVESLRLSLAADVLPDYSDADIGMTTVDLVGWQPLQVTVTFKDATVDTGTTAQRLLAAGAGALTVKLLARGGGTDQNLTINNLKWTAPDQQEAASDHTLFTLQGQSSWYKPLITEVAAKDYTLTGEDALFAFAAA